MVYRVKQGYKVLLVFEPITLAMIHVLSLKGEYPSKTRFYKDFIAEIDVSYATFTRKLCKLERHGIITTVKEEKGNGLLGKKTRIRLTEKGELLARFTRILLGTQGILEAMPEP